MSDTTQRPPRIRADRDELVPRMMVRAMFALVVTCLVLVAAARLTDRPLEHTPADMPVIKERVIFLDGDMSGAAQIYDENHVLIADLTPEAGGFISGVKRVLDRERLKHRVPADGPVLLQLREGNRLSIHDPSTNWSAELMGFGATNLRSFARLLEQP
ncbi:photosynthetic complex assembly protein PuhC [Thalassococcus sp. S3]|uniref:photosynthetic complex assembly protein PuhC n=1 Tax=Thalassococcus sp. S3 TaxID=2017482 RepID=UPI001023FB09|nr:photosynthetic complex assembly protein PuhC [Thalassococcus sp. S3]QBF34228.1 pullulanase [Thalassococcus sp. S3]